MYSIHAETKNSATQSTERPTEMLPKAFLGSLTVLCAAIAAFNVLFSAFVAGVCIIGEFGLHTLLLMDDAPISHCSVHNCLFQRDDCLLGIQRTIRLAFLDCCDCNATTLGHSRSRGPAAVASCFRKLIGIQSRSWRCYHLSNSCNIFPIHDSTQFRGCGFRSLL
jgi:hypothetical protein